MSSISTPVRSGEMYGRLYEVQIASGALARPDDNEELKKAYRYGNISGLNPLHVQFTVEQLTEGPSKCHITIGNLAESVRNNIRPRDAIRLYAGYPQSFGLVHCGYIETHESRQVGPDVFTKVTCSGEAPQIEAARYTQSFVGKTKRSAVLADIQKRCKLRISSSGRSTVVQVARSTYANLQEVEFPNGIAFDTSPLLALRQIFPPPYKVSIEDGVILLEDITQPFRRVVVILNKSTGLIGTPGTTEHGAYTVYKFVSLMNVRLRAGAFVALTIGDAAKPAYCCVQTARFNGDSRGGPWFVECVASQCDPSDPDATIGSLDPNFMDAFSAEPDSEGGAEEGLEE